MPSAPIAPQLSGLGSNPLLAFITQLFGALPADALQNMMQSGLTQALNQQAQGAGPSQASGSGSRGKNNDDMDMEESEEESDG